MFSIGDKQLVWPYKLDPKNKTIDVTVPGVKKTGLGLDSLEDDELKIILGDERPKEFKSREKSKDVLMVFKRVK